MAVELTLSIIKPDAVARNLIGAILSKFESNGLRIAAAKFVHLRREQLEQIYGAHKGAPYYDDLMAFMTSGPVFLSVLEGENAIAKNREIMGNTDPKKAAPGTIRAEFATATNRNCAHGSDSPESARFEIQCLFEPHELYTSLSADADAPRYQSVGT